MKHLKSKIVTLAIISAISVGIVFNAHITNIATKPATLKPQSIQLYATTSQSDLEKQYKIGYDQFFAKKYALAIATENKVIKINPSFYKAYAVKGIAYAYNGVTMA